MGAECKEAESIEQVLARIKKTIEEGPKSIRSVDGVGLLDNAEEVLELTNIVQYEGAMADRECAGAVRNREENLISDYVHNLTRKVNALADGRHVVSEQEIHDLFKEMLKPYLKSWLNNNLPGLAKEVLEAEIKKIFNKNDTH